MDWLASHDFRLGGRRDVAGKVARAGLRRTGGQDFLLANSACRFVNHAAADAKSG